MEATINELKTSLDKTLEFLHTQYGQLQVGRASSGLVELLDVEAYGTISPLKSMANISIPDAKSIVIQPWDRNVLGDIEKAIQNSDLNINPVNDGTVLRLNLPPMTEERRVELVKVVHKMAEEAKITVRQGREKVHKEIQNMEKANELSEDEARDKQSELQEIVDKYNKEIDDIRDKKEKDIMTI